MSAPRRGDAAFKYQEGSGTVFWHHMGHPLHRAVADISLRVDTFRSVDFTTERRIAIGSGVQDLRASMRKEGTTESLRRFLASARRGASLEYFPSLANPSESYPCVLVDDSAVGNDPDFWFEYRNAIDVVLRRIDGGSWVGITEGSLFYYLAGNELPGLTFTRSGAVGKYVDELGVVQDAAADIVRTTWDGGTPRLLLEAPRTNLVSSDDFDAGWASAGSPVVTGSVTDSAGGTGAYTIEDDAGTLESKSLVVAFTGDATKSVIFEVRENTMPASGNQALWLYDDTGAAARVQFNITSWVDGEPQITAAVGTLLGVRQIGNGYWRVYGLSTTVTAASTHRLIVEPASTAAQTGSIDIYRANAFDSPVPSSSLLDASETRNVDTLYADFLHAPQTMTVYAKFIERGGVDTGVDGAVFEIGGAGGSDDPRFLVSSTGGFYRIQHDNGVDIAGATLGAAPSWGDEVEIRATLNADGSVEIGQSINGGAETTASDATAVLLGSAWADTRIYINSRGTVGQGLGEYEAVKILPGVKTLAEMRSA